MFNTSEAITAFTGHLAKVKQISGGYHPLCNDVFAASRACAEVEKEIRRIGTAPNRNLNLVPEATKFLKWVFPSGVTPSGTLIDPAGIREVAKYNFNFFC